MAQNANDVIANSYQRNRKNRFSESDRNCLKTPFVALKQNSKSGNTALSKNCKQRHRV